MQSSSKLAIYVAILLCFGGPLTGTAGSKKSVSVPHLFKLLLSERTTNEATAKFLALGPSDADARKYLAQHLPSTLDQEPKSYYVWVNCARLAGAFRLAEAVPALIKSIDAGTLEGSTLTSRNRLDAFPYAKSLVLIGEPSVLALTEVLKNGTSRHRWFAYRALFLIGSPRSLAALQEDIEHESDPELKREIQQALNRL